MATSMIEVDESEHLEVTRPPVHRHLRSKPSKSGAVSFIHPASARCPRSHIPPNFSSFPSHHHPIKFVSLQLRAAHDHPAERRFFRRARMQARSSSQRRRGSDAMDVESAPLPTPTAPLPPLAVFGMLGVSTAISESGMSFRGVDDDEDMERDSHPAETVAQSQLLLAQQPQSIDEDDDMLADTGVAPSPAVVRNQPEAPSKVHETPSKPSESSPEPIEVAKLNDTPPKVATPSQTTSSANGGESVDKTNKMETKVDEVTRVDATVRVDETIAKTSQTTVPVEAPIAAVPTTAAAEETIPQAEPAGSSQTPAAPQVPMNMAKMRLNEALQETARIRALAHQQVQARAADDLERLLLEALGEDPDAESPSTQPASSSAPAVQPSLAAPVTLHSLMSSIERDPSRIPYEAKGKWVDRRSAGKLPSQSPRTTAPASGPSSAEAADAVMSVAPQTLSKDKGKGVDRSGALAPPSRSSSPSTSQSVLDEAFRLSKEAQGKGNSSMPPPSTKATPATRVVPPRRTVVNSPQPMPPPRRPAETAPSFGVIMTPLTGPSEAAPAPLPTNPEKRLKEMRFMRQREQAAARKALLDKIKGKNDEAISQAVAPASPVVTAAQPLFPNSNPSISKLDASVPEVPAKTNTQDRPETVSSSSGSNSFALRPSILAGSSSVDTSSRPNQLDTPPATDGMSDVDTNQVAGPAACEVTNNVKTDHSLDSGSSSLQATTLASAPPSAPANAEKPRDAMALDVGITPSANHMDGGDFADKNAPSLAIQPAEPGADVSADEAIFDFGTMSVAEILGIAPHGGNAVDGTEVLPSFSPLDAAVRPSNPLDVAVGVPNPLDAAVGSTNTLDAAVLPTRWDSTTHPSNPLGAAVLPSNPLDAAIRPSNPLDATVRPTNSWNPAMHFSNPLDAAVPSANLWNSAVHPSNPLDAAVRPSNPLDAAVGVPNPLDAAVGFTNPLDAAVRPTNSWGSAIHLSNPLDAAVRPADPWNAALSPNPLDAAVRPSNPLDAAVHPYNPLDAAVRPSNPLDTAVGISNPIQHGTFGGLPSPVPASGMLFEQEASRSRSSIAADWGPLPSGDPVADADNSTAQNEDAMDFEYFADFFVPTEQPPLNYAEYADAAASYTADPMIWNAIFDNGPTAQPTVQPTTSAPENSAASGVEDYTQLMDIFEEDVIAKIAAEADEMHAPMFIMDDPDDPCVFPGFSCNRPSRSGSRLGDARPTQTTPPIVSAAADKKPSLSERLGPDPLTAPSFFTGSSAFNASSPTDESLNTPAPTPEPASLSAFGSRSLLSNFGSLDSGKASVSAEEPSERAPPSLSVPPAELPQESPPAVTQPRAARPTPPPDPIPEFEDVPCPKPTMVRSTPWCRKAHEGMPLTRSMYRIVPHPESRRQMSYGRPVPESVIDEQVRARLHGVYKKVDPAPAERHAASPSTRRKKARKAASRHPRDPATASGDVSGLSASTSKREPPVSAPEDEPPVSTSTESPVSTPSDTDDADDTPSSVEDFAAPIQDPNDGIVSLAICIGAVAAVQVVPVVAKHIANWCFAAWMTAS